MTLPGVAVSAVAFYFLKSWRFDSSCPSGSLGYPSGPSGSWTSYGDSKPSALSLYTLHGHGRQLCCDPERSVDTFCEGKRLHR